MTQTFKAGDPVRHKSGGPKMTVVAFAKFGIAATEEQYHCRWFNGPKQEFVDGYYVEAELERYPER